eukprot:EG_transcript_3598
MRDEPAGGDADADGDGLLDPDGRFASSPSWDIHSPPDTSAGSPWCCLAPIHRLAEWLRLLVAVFGWKFLVLVVFGEHLLKGFLSGSGSNTGGLLVIEGLIYLRLQVGASTKTLLMAVSGSSWSLKPLYGLLSDALVVAGYRRVPWILTTALLSTAAYVCISVGGRDLGPFVLCGCFFFVRMQNAWTDLMVEAAYSEKMRAHPTHASDILTWVWGGIGIATVAGVLVVGPGLDYFDPFALAGVGAPVAFAIVVPAALGWLGEARAPVSCGLHWQLLRGQWQLFACSGVLAVAVLGSCVCTVLGVALGAQAAVAVGGMLAVVGAAAWLLPAGLWRPLVFMFLSSAVCIDTYGFVDNFYLDAATPEESLRNGYPVCVDCPHFSNTFYITVVGIFDASFMMVGSWLFNTWMKDWTYRRALAVTQVLFMLASLVDIVQFQRWNKRLGIPDAVFMVGKHAVQNTCSMLNYMPSAILMSKLCPPGVESTMFSLLAGFGNFGMVVASYLGAYVLSVLGLSEVGNGPVDDFRNAWKACVVNACAPVLLLLLLPVLIPDALISAPLTLGGPAEASEPDVLALTDSEDHVSVAVDDPDPDRVEAAWRWVCDPRRCGRFSPGWPRRPGGPPPPPPTAPQRCS